LTSDITPPFLQRAQDLSHHRDTLTLDLTSSIPGPSFGPYGPAYNPGTLSWQEANPEYNIFQFKLRKRRPGRVPAD